MDLLIWSGILATSIFFLVKSADFFTDYAEKIGESFGMQQFVIGIIIVSIGTSLPEFATSLVSAIQGEGGMAAGNVYGTVIVNILLGFGIAAIFSKKEITFKSNIFYADMPILIGGMFFSYFIFFDNSLSRGESIILLIGFIIYLKYIFAIHKKTNTAEHKRPPFKFINFMGAIVSLTILAFASNYVVEAAIKVAELLKIGNSEIASSIIATGTSLPEITVAYIAARKGKFELLVGDIIGSNIFDIFIIPGTFGLLSSNTIVTTELMALTIPFCLASAIIYWIVSVDGKISKPEGAFMILMYGLYIGKLFSFF